MNYTRCSRIDEAIQCETWFPADGNSLCPDCRKLLNSSVAVLSEETKKNYIAFINGHRAECSTMNLTQLQDHIKGLETKMEEVRAIIQTSKQVLREKLDDLNDEQRKVFLTEMKMMKPLKAPKQKKERFSGYIGDPLGIGDMSSLLEKFKLARAAKENES